MSSKKESVFITFLFRLSKQVPSFVPLLSSLTFSNSPALQFFCFSVHCRLEPTVVTLISQSLALVVIVVLSYCLLEFMRLCNT